MHFSVVFIPLSENQTIIMHLPRIVLLLVSSGPDDRGCLFILLTLSYMTGFISTFIIEIRIHIFCYLSIYLCSINIIDRIAPLRNFHNYKSSKFPIFILFVFYEIVSNKNNGFPVRSHYNKSVE